MGKEKTAVYIRRWSEAALPHAGSTVLRTHYVRSFVVVL